MAGPLVRSAREEKVIQIVKTERQPGLVHCPEERVGYRGEDLGHGTQPKGERRVEIDAVAPGHSEQMVVIRMHEDHQRGALQIHLRHQRSPTQANQCANGVLNPRVADEAQLG